MASCDENNTVWSQHRRHQPAEPLSQHAQQQQQQQQRSSGGGRLGGLGGTGRGSRPRCAASLLLIRARPEERRQGAGRGWRRAACRSGGVGGHFRGRAVIWPSGRRTGQLQHPAKQRSRRLQPEQVDSAAWYRSRNTTDRSVRWNRVLVNSNRVALVSVAVVSPCRPLGRRPKPGGRWPSLGDPPLSLVIRIGIIRIAAAAVAGVTFIQRSRVSVFDLIRCTDGLLVSLYRWFRHVQPSNGTTKSGPHMPESAVLYVASGNPVCMYLWVSLFVRRKIRLL